MPEQAAIGQWLLEFDESDLAVLTHLAPGSAEPTCVEYAQTFLHQAAYRALGGTVTLQSRGGRQVPQASYLAQSVELKANVKIPGCMDGGSDRCLRCGACFPGSQGVLEPSHNVATALLAATWQEEVEFLHRA